MKKESIVSFTTSDAKYAADQILSHLKESKILLLIGDLGTGKTTLSKHICANLGYSGEVTSPTYSLVNEYILPTNDFIYHMDLYRLLNLYELQEIGFLEYLDSRNYCIIEWPQIALDLLDMPHYICTIQHDEPSRKYNLEYYS
jgi:tRNA threonylcarbamoyladenosine biosynthesis protein TsaE